MWKGTCCLRLVSTKVSMETTAGPTLSTRSAIVFEPNPGRLFGCEKLTVEIGADACSAVAAVADRLLKYNIQPEAARPREKASSIAIRKYILTRFFTSATSLCEKIFTRIIITFFGILSR